VNGRREEFSRARIKSAAETAGTGAALVGGAQAGRKRKIKAPPCRAAGAKERSRKDGGRDLDLYISPLLHRAAGDGGCRLPTLAAIPPSSHPSSLPCPPSSPPLSGRIRSVVLVSQRNSLVSGYIAVIVTSNESLAVFRASLARVNMYAYMCTGAHPRRDDTAFSSGEVIRV